ncbi:MAG: polyprenyl synthetase family protein [Bacteroidaceae bacterium]|nr:polyprenyl synthetase family protein [Bacteroidaceae bacterium]MBR4782361.1 polyprenyl synthetase family protein [Bacteroidaceae bacterium]
MILSERQILQQVNEAIAAIEYPPQPKGLYEPIRYVLSIGGKRIRPVMMLLTAQALGCDIRKVMPAAVGLETYHNYTLLHDDLMDRADMRRGMPTVHRKWDSNTAILSGDSMLVLACKHILSTPLPRKGEAMNVFVHTALQIGEGQQYDMNFETRNDVAQDEYIEMIRLKTSVLIACAAKMGALLANADDQVADSLYRFGEQIGLAFQLQDDLLDVYGDPQVFGKRIGGDILCNKKTFLLINAMQLANTSQREQLNSWINRKNFDEQEKISTITEIYNQLDIRQLTAERINYYFMQAQHTLNNIPLSQEGKQSLRDFANSLINRPA